MVVDHLHFLSKQKVGESFKVICGGVFLNGKQELIIGLLTVVVLWFIK